MMAWYEPQSWSPFPRLLLGRVQIGFFSWVEQNDGQAVFDCRI